MSEYPTIWVGKEFYPYQLNKEQLARGPQQVMFSDIFSRVLLEAPPLPTLLIVTRLFYGGVGTSYKDWKVGIRSDRQYLEENGIGSTQLRDIGHLTVLLTTADGTYKGFPVYEGGSLEFKYFIPSDSKNTKPFPTVKHEDPAEIANLKEKFTLEL